MWTPQLHQRFVDAVKQLGLKNAVPKTIMQVAPLFLQLKQPSHPTSLKMRNVKEVEDPPPSPENWYSIFILRLLNPALQPL